MKSVYRRAIPAPIIRLSTSILSFLQHSLENFTHLAPSFPAAIDVATILQQRKVEMFLLRFVLRCGKLHVPCEDCESKTVNISYHLKPR